LDVVVESVLVVLVPHVSAPEVILLGLLDFGGQQISKFLTVLLYEILGPLVHFPDLLLSVIKLLLFFLHPWVLHQLIGLIDLLITVLLVYFFLISLRFLLIDIYLELMLVWLYLLIALALLCLVTAFFEVISIFFLIVSLVLIVLLGLALVIIVFLAGDFAIRLLSDLELLEMALLFGLMGNFILILVAVVT
jgi:hypothetical protein